MDNVVGLGLNVRVILASDGDDRSAAGLDLFQVAHHFVIDGAVRGEKHRRRLRIDQGNGAMLHLGGRIALSVNIADFLEFESAFEGDRIKILPAEVEHVAGVAIFLGDALDSIMTL